MKTCIKCNIEKPLSEFYKWKDGYRGTCKQCCSKAAKERRLKSAQRVGHNQKNLAMPSQEDLKALFDYHKDGYFIRKVARGTQKAGSECRGKMEKHGYRRLPLSHNLYLMHRLIWKWHHGTEPEFIDHIDHDRDNNRIENLRSVTKNQNAQHQLLQCNNTSGYFGVHWNYLMKGGSWQSVIRANGKDIHLGYYHDKRQAVLAYNDAAEKLHGIYGKDKVNHNLEQLKKEFG